jgi:hypothetical protein
MERQPLYPRGVLMKPPLGLVHALTQVTHIFYTLITAFQIGNPGSRGFFEAYSSSLESKMVEGLRQDLAEFRERYSQRWIVQRHG